MKVFSSNRHCFKTLKNNAVSENANDFQEIYYNILNKKAATTILQ